jgi:hypothetical protein
MPHSTYSKKKKFSSCRRDNDLFRELKRSKLEETAQNFEKRFFYKQILDFYCPSKILCHTSKLRNFVKITGPYCINWQKRTNPGQAQAE